MLTSTKRLQSHPVPGFVKIATLHLSIEIDQMPTNKRTFFYRRIYSCWKSKLYKELVENLRRLTGEKEYLKVN